jgi:hypothetical protein
MSGDATRWQESRLWTTLQARSTDKTAANRSVAAVMHTLEGVMPMVQQVLAQAGTSAPDFTLHDAGHGFRVAERMVELVGAEKLGDLSEYELGMLLLSAYLHDIGMTPRGGKVTAHLEHLLSAQSKLTAAEVETFRSWLDQYEVSVPLPQGEVRHAERLVALFCRHEHNKWSGEWIRETFDGRTFGTYGRWVADLIDLCSSHHYGYDELKKPKFEPRLVGEPSTVVNLRYLAAVLRMADILEFSPERTPEVILEHREVNPDSVIYWQKDKEIILSLSGNRIMVHAQPSSAVMHRALEIMIAQIEEEARLCRRLQDDGLYANLMGRRLPHHWRWEAAVAADVRQSEAYEYIDGSFRPNTAKLLNLLSGTQLYGSPLHAVRELLQNAFDAVREQIAWQRLGNEALADSLAAAQLVQLRIESREDADYLICEDTGVGMSKPIIRDYLLVSGASNRPELTTLERRCRDRGFELERTGEFGLGVLSYFMLADRITIQTRRSQDAGGFESNGWRFETSGLGSFGELRRDLEITRGTKVTLRLRKRLSFSDLEEYVAKTLVFLPCRLKLEQHTSSRRAIAVGREFHSLLGSVGIAIDLPATPEYLAAWQRDSNHECPAGWQHGSHDLHSGNWRRVGRGFGDADYLRSKESSDLHWHVASGTLRDNLGRYRIHVPYFTSEGGRSLFGLGDKGIKIRRSKPVFMSWKGMATHGEEKEDDDYIYGHSRHIGIIEVDWYSRKGARVSVDRRSVDLSAEGEQALLWLKSHRDQVIGNFIKESVTPRFATVSSAIASLDKNCGQEWWWIFPESASRDVQKVATPVAYRNDFPGRAEGRWKNQRLSFVTNLDGGISPPLPVPSVVAACGWNGGCAYLPIWEYLDGESPVDFAPHVRFPPGWDQVAALASARGWLLNKNNSAAALIKQPLREAYGGVEYLRDDIRQQIASDPSLAALHLVKHGIDLQERSRYSSPGDATRGFERDQRPKDLVKTLWTLVFGRNAKTMDGNWKPIVVGSWLRSDQGSHRVTLVVNTPEETKYVSEAQDVRSYLPDPPPEWTVHWDPGSMVDVK